MKTLSCVLGRRMCRSMIWMIALFTMFGSEAGLAQYIKTVIMVSGQVAPGTNGAVFDDFFPPVALGISQYGKVVFEAWLEDGVGDTNPGNNRGIWVAENGIIKLVARKGGSVPGLPGQIFSSLPKVFIDADGQIGLDALFSSAGNTGGSKHGFFMEELGELVLKLTPGMEILPGVQLSISFSVSAFNSGRVLFSGFLDGDGINTNNDIAVCVLGPDGITVLAQKGDTMVGIGGNFIYTAFSTFENPLTSFGATIFRANGTDIVDFVNIGAVYTWSPTVGIKLFKKSGPDSTLTIFAEYRSNSSPFSDISGHGWIVFPTKRVIWKKNYFDLNTNTVVTQGDIAPGAGGETFSAFLEFVLFDNITIATLASTSAGRLGIWIEGRGGMEKVAVIGDPAPGVPEGFKFFRVNNMMANSKGQVAFADLVVSDTGDELQGMWVGNANGLSLVAVRNEQIEISPGQIRTIEDATPNTAIRTRTGVDGHPTNFNDANQIAFILKFSEGGNALVVARPGLIVNSTRNTLLQIFNPLFIFFLFFIFICKFF